MSPDELYQAAGDVIVCCNPAGVTDATARAFIDQLLARIRSIGGWLPPANGLQGYGDSQLIDQLRQVKFQTERVIRNFPMGVEALSMTLENFRLYLKSNYTIKSEDL